MESRQPIDSECDSSATTLLLTVTEVARLLGISTRSVWRLARAGRCPEPVRLGRATRWRRREVEAWVSEGCRMENRGSRPIGRGHPLGE
jgi:excisionase family DNA binding protein